MTTSTEWHIRDDVVARFASDPRTLSDGTATSAEAHLLTCERCRQRVADATSTQLLEVSWFAVVDVVDRPRRGFVQRAIEALGVRPEVARLAAATPSLQVAWLCAVAVVTVLAVTATNHRDLRSVFLALAPIVPLGSVAISFLPGAEPGGEAGFAAPISGASLVLRRGVGVILASLLILIGGAVALPGASSADAAWVLPALGLTLSTLAAATRWPVEHAATAIAVGWIVTLAALNWLADEATLVNNVLFDPVGQLAALACAAAAATILVARRDDLAPLGGS